MSSLKLLKFLNRIPAVSRYYRPSTTRVITENDEVIESSSEHHHRIDFDLDFIDFAKQSINRTGGLVAGTAYPKNAPQQKTDTSYGEKDNFNTRSRALQFYIPRIYTKNGIKHKFIYSRIE